MDLPSNTELNRIVKLCRLQGVKVFECGELRITLSDAALATPPSKKSRRSILAGPDAPKGSIQGDNTPDSLPSEEELLFASVGGPPPEMLEN